jgi:GDP-mannose transporter
MAMQSLSPGFVSFVQIVFAALSVLVIKWCGISKVDEFTWDKAVAFSGYVAIFVVTIFANMSALANSNVETVIVFRACTPLATCVIEYLFMGRELPSTRSAMSLAMCVFGAVVYCISDSQLALNGFAGYYWLVSYFVLISVEMTYGKTLTVSMDTVWGPVLYQNLLSIIPMFLIGMYQSEGFMADMVRLQSLSVRESAVLLFSCVVGTLIGCVSTKLLSTPS